MPTDTDITWVTPLPRSDGSTKKFLNEAERGFAQFLDVCDIDWEYEPHFYIKRHTGLPAGHSDKGYCPDFYLPLYDVYVEIHGADKADRSHRQLTPKRAKIRWLSSRTGKTVVLVHFSNWPEDREDLERLIKRASQEALKVRQEFLQAHREEV